MTPHQPPVTPLMPDVIDLECEKAKNKINMLPGPDPEYEYWDSDFLTKIAYDAAKHGDWCVKKTEPPKDRPITPLVKLLLRNPGGDPSKWRK